MNIHHDEDSLLQEELPRGLIMFLTRMNGNIENILRDVHDMREEKLASRMTNMEAKVSLLWKIFIGTGTAFGVLIVGSIYHLITSGAV